MEITGNTDAIIKLFEMAANDVRAGRPETIAEAIEAYQVFWTTCRNAKFTDKSIIENLSDLKNEWSSFLSRDQNVSRGDAVAVTTVVSEIHKAIEDALRGRRAQVDFDGLVNKLRGAVTATTDPCCDQRQSIDVHKNDSVELPPPNIVFQKKIYCERFKVSKDYDCIVDTVHKPHDYPEIQNLGKISKKVKTILAKLFAAYGKKRTGGWVYSEGGNWGPYFGKKPYSLFKNQQISVRRNPETNKCEWRIIPLAEFDEASPIGRNSRRKNHSNSKIKF